MTRPNRKKKTEAKPHSESEIKTSLNSSNQIQKTSKSEIDDIFNTQTFSKKTVITNEDEKKKNENAEKKETNPTLKIADTSMVVPVVNFSDIQMKTKKKQKRSSEFESSDEKKLKIESKAEFLGKNSGKKRLTEEGYRVYYLEDLVSQSGGETKLCPFDCECCF